MNTTVSKKIENILPSKKSFIIFCISLLVFTFGSLIALANENTVIVEADILNVRYGPGLSHNILTEVKENDRLFILGEENKWYKVRLKNDQVGWVASWLVNSENIMNENPQFIKVIGETVNIRQFSNSDSKIVGLAYKDTELEVLHREPEWFQILYMGKVAWINANYVEDIEVLQDIEKEQPIEKPNNPQPATSLAEATIVIDAGHGGKDAGAISSDKSFYEKNITLSTAQILANRLQDAGTNVVMTRKVDEFLSLEERVQKSHDFHADAFISLHYDAVEVANTMSGTTTYHYSDEDFNLASKINNRLIESTPLSNNGVRFGDYYILRNNKQPSILIELGYINHYTDIEYINTETYQAAVVEAIYQGLRDHFD